MNKSEIIDSLNLNHQRFVKDISLLDDKSFMFSLNNQKWSAGQQMEHIRRSLFPLNLILGFPKWITTLIFNKANRPSKSYEELVNKYFLKLKNGGRSSGRFVPGKIEVRQKETIIRKIESLVATLSKSLNKYSEHEIDMLVLPHPLLGKVTLREMMYFTIYHVVHHHKITLRNLEENNLKSIYKKEQ